MYKKLAISLLSLLIVLLSVSAVAQDEATIDEVVIDDASLEEVTTDSPTADIGLDQPADSGTDDVLLDPAAPEPIDSFDQTQTTAPMTTDDTTYRTQATAGRTYYDGVNTYANSRVQFRLRSTDNNQLDRIMFTIDDAGEQTYSSPFSISEEGRHTIKYYGIDRIGNIENQQLFNVYIDNTAPTITVNTETPIQLINGRYYIAQQARVTIDAQDAMSGVRSVMYSLNGNDYQAYTTAFTFNVINDINFKVKAEDNVGNVAENYRMMLPDVSGNQGMRQNRDITFSVDNEAPTVQIAADREFVQRNGRAVAGNDYRYSITANDNDSGVSQILYRTDGQGSFRAYEQPFMLPNNGDHFIEARAVDAVGNVSETAILSVYVDVIPPNSSITTITEEGESQPQQ
jgi:hypothetical protein